MKRKTNKKTIILGGLASLSIFIVLGSYMFSDTITRANQLTEDTSNEQIVLLDNVPTGNEPSTSSTKETPPKTTDTEAPVITAADNSVEQGSVFNPLTDVTATDNIDGDLTGQVTAENTLDTSTAGDQVIQLAVTDKSGNKATTTKTIHVIAKATPNVQEESATQTDSATPTVAEQAPVQTAAAQPVQTAPSYAPMTLTLAGQAIAYQNGGQGSGQSIIDANPSGVASTWGGAATQSGDDGLNTHFIGHNPGAFSAIFNLGSGSPIVVTDGNGTPTTYTVRSVFQVNDYGEEVGTGTDYWDLIVGSGGGERITLQSCINDDINLVVIAYK